jgi:Mrp family chromosome partitioning ATPase
MLIIDSPPVLPFTDAAVLAKVVDATLLVVRANSTRMDKLEQAIQALRTVDAQLAGAVLNMVQTSGPEIDYYGYYSDAPGREGETKKPTKTASNGSPSTPEAERTSLTASRD